MSTWITKSVLILSLAAPMAVAALEVGEVEGWVRQVGAKHRPISDLLDNPEFLITKKDTLKQDFILSVIVHKHKAPKTKNLATKDEWRNFLAQRAERKIVVTNHRLLGEGPLAKFIMEYQMPTESKNLLSIAVMAVRDGDDIYTFTFRNFKEVYREHAPAVLKLFETLPLRP